MTLDEFVKVLTGTGIKTFHQTAPPREPMPYIVWNTVSAVREYPTKLIVQRIQVDFYTQKELDPRTDKLINALDDSEIFHEEPSVYFDEELRATRYLLHCQIITARKTERMNFYGSTNTGGCLPRHSQYEVCD